MILKVTHQEIRDEKNWRVPSEKLSFNIRDFFFCFGKRICVLLMNAGDF